MKKTRILFCLFSVLFHVALAQQKPQFTQYVFNNLLFNPAVSGIENYTDLKAGYRSQWTGLDGAPVTSFLSVSMPIGNNFLQGDATSFPVQNGDNPSSRLYTQNYMAAEPHHGIGLIIMSDQTGPISQTNIDATYAYHLGLSAGVNLSVGFIAGLSHVNLNTAMITTETPNDPAIINGDNSLWAPDLGAGTWLYASNYYIGASVQQLLPQSLYFNTNNVYNQVKASPEYFLTAGVKLFVADDVTFLPSFLLKAVSPEPVSCDINAKLNFNDKFWIGGSYRTDDSFAALIGVNINSFINVSYSYDFTTSALNTVSSGSHEIVISLLLNNRYKVTCPMRTF
jgi:type IX secretion system PorP/SprF family membrane protein